MKKYLFGTATILFTVGLLIPLSAFAAPEISGLSPTDDTIGGLSYGEFSVSFAVPVLAGTGNITLHKASDDSVIETVDIGDVEVGSDEGEGYMYWESSADLEYATEYYINLDTGIVTDEGLDPFSGILDTTTWNFTTRPPLGVPVDTFERISVGSLGEEGNDESALSIGSPQPPFLMSTDGMLISFYSKADNFTEEVITADSAVFLRDRNDGTTHLIPGTETGAGRIGGISEDGASVFYDRNATFPTSIFKYDTGTEITTKITSGADGGSDVKGISRNGQYVGLYSNATNLVLGDVNGAGDMFIYDVVGEEFSKIGDNIVPYANIEISPDGQKILFASIASDLVGGDTNGAYDVFLYDRGLDSFERVSVGNDEEEGNAHSGVGGNEGQVMSDDGRYIVFNSNATNLTSDGVGGSNALFLRDTLEGTTVLISDSAVNPSISSDGRYIVYIRFGTEGHYDEGGVYRYDREEDTTLFVTEGADAGGDSVAANFTMPAVSSDGSLIVFDSNAINLVDNDTNGNQIFDVFLWDESVQVEEEPEEEPTVEEDEPVHSSSSHRRSAPTTPDVTVPSAQDSEDEIMSLQVKLIELLKQLLAELMATR